MVAITSLRKDVIFAAVRAMYTDVALYPARDYHVPVGPVATRFVGYPPDLLDRLPASVVESFAGVGYPFAANVIRPGDTVLDIGSGSGTDLLIAAQMVGTKGRVIGLDMTAAMLGKLEKCVAAGRAHNVSLMQGNAEHLPLPDASVDVVTSNGVFNLLPDKRAPLADMFRVLRPGGRVQIADIAVGRPVSGECAADPRLWAECIVGASLEDEYLATLEAAGFTRIEALGHLDYFAASTNAETRSIAGLFRACSLVIRAAKSPSSPFLPPLPWPSAESSALASTHRDRDARLQLPLPADAVLDGYGRTCGALEPEIKGRMRALESGQVLEVRVDDPSGRLGVPAWCRLAGHTLLATIVDDGQRTRFFVRKR
jgi:arsenite methyltransferase